MRRHHRAPHEWAHDAGIAAAVIVTNVSSTLRSVAETRYEDLSLFTNVLNLVRRNYVEPVEESELVKGAVRGMYDGESADGLKATAARVRWLEAHPGR